MVDPTEPEDQAKGKGPKTEAPSLASGTQMEAPRLPDQGDGKATEEGGDAETTSTHTAGLGERTAAPPPVGQEASPPSPYFQAAKPPKNIQLHLPHLPNLYPASPPPPKLQTPSTPTPIRQPHSPSPPDLQPPSPSPSDLQPPSPSTSDLQPPSPSPSNLQPPSPSPPDLQPHSPSPPDLQPPSPSSPDLQPPSPPPPDLQPPSPLPPDLQSRSPPPPDLQPPSPSPPDLQPHSPSPPDLQPPSPPPPDLQPPSPSPPDLQAPSNDPEPREPSPKLHLDLYNFDTPAAEGSRYVLTSPRSLEACARCGVKPVELLSRPLSDFAREAPGRSMRVATGMFEVYEKDRHAKLRACREERERIVREETIRILQAAVNGHAASSPEEQHKTTVTPCSTQPAIPGLVSPSSATKPKPHPSRTGQPSKATSIATSGPDIHRSSTAPLARSNSLQPSKTSPMTSSPKGLNSASGSGPVKRQKSSSSSEQTRAPRPVSGPPAVVRKVPASTPKTSNTFPRSASKPCSFPRAAVSMAPTMSRGSLQSPVNPSTTALNGHTGPGGSGGTPSLHNGHPVSSPKGQSKSHSLESLQRRMETISTSTTNSTTTCTSSGEESGASSSYSWDGPRDHWSKSSPRARTLATFNSLMGRSLSLGDLSHSLQTTQKVERIVKEVRRRGLKAVPERDRKIAALMLARYQEEDIMSQTRYVAHLQWDSEKRLGDLQREREDREKQRAVLQCQRAWQSQVSYRQRRLSQQEREAAAAKLRQVAESEERRRDLAEQQERSRLQRLQQAAREEKMKKEQQEQNLRALEEERAAVLEQELLLLKEKLTMAELKKQEKEHQSQNERRGLNRAERRRHAALLREIARREEEEREEARKTAEEKLSRSLENYEQIVGRRDRELKEKAKKEEQQIQKARRAAEKREKEQQQQLEARAREAERRAQQAALVAEERAREKAQRAVQSRQDKERLQRLNRQRVEDEEQARRMDLLQSIERKLEKSEQIFREKRAVLESARSTARASFHVRDRVREETNMRTFDKMALEAQFQFKTSLEDK